MTFEPFQASPCRAQPTRAIALISAPPPPDQTEQAALGAVCDIPACPGLAQPDTAGHPALPWHCHARAHLAITGNPSARQSTGIYRLLTGPARLCAAWFARGCHGQIGAVPAMHDIEFMSRGGRVPQSCWEVGGRHFVQKLM